MRRILLSTVAFALCVALAGTAQAGPKRGGGGGHANGGHANGGHATGGYRKGGGYGKGGYGRGHHGERRGSGKVPYYKGRGGHRWSAKVWDHRYGCGLYHDGDTGCWYYWCPPDDCYYPVDYCPYDTYSWDE
jgi:hypothetical protein